MRTKPKLPKSAKRVFHGEIFDVYQWRQKVYDGSFQTYEMLARPDTVVIIAITEDKKIVIQRQSQPYPGKAFDSLPGGRVDDGETPLAAAKRELREETGYTSSTWKLWKSKRATSKIDWDIHTFIAYNCRKTHPQTLDEGERIKTYTLSFRQFSSMALSGKFGRDLKLEFFEAKAAPTKLRQLKRLLRIA